MDPGSSHYSENLWFSPDTWLIIDLIMTTPCVHTFDWASGALEELALGLLFLGHLHGPSLPIAAPAIAETGSWSSRSAFVGKSGPPAVSLDTVSSNIQVFKSAGSPKINSDLGRLKLY